MRTRKFVWFGLVACIFLGIDLLFPATAIFRGHRDFVRYIVSSPDGHNLASISDDRTVRLWDVASRRTRLILPIASESSCSPRFVFSPDGRRLALAVNETTIELWDVPTGSKMATLKGHTGKICSIAIGPDDTLATASRDKTVRLWDVTSGEERFILGGHMESVK